MKIIALATERVRNLPDQSWHFDPAFQIIHGPNEAGKSALHEAIRIGLYGDAKSTAQAYAEARRWGHPDGIAVALTVLVPEGEYIIRRDFAERRNMLIGPDGKPFRGEQSLQEFLRRHVPLPTEDSFLATACVRQDELAQVVAKATALRPLLEQHALSGAGVDVEDLRKRLDRHLLELKRGLDKPAPKNPGRIVTLRAQRKDLTDTIDRLTREISEGGKAAEDLTALERELVTLREERDLKRIHLERHAKLQEARTRLEDAKKRILRAQEKIDRAHILTANLPGLADAAKQAGGSLQARRTRLDRAGAYRTVAQQAQEFRNELGQLQADLGILGEINARLTTYEEARRRIPLSPEDLDNLRAIPEEIKKLEAGVHEADAERKRLTVRLAQADTEFVEGGRRLDGLTAQQTALGQTLDTAEERARLEDELRQIRRAIPEKEKRVLHLRELRNASLALADRREPYAHLNSLDVSRFADLSTRVTTLRTTLESAGVEVRLIPKAPVTLTVRADDRPEERHADQLEPLVVRAAEHARIDVEPLLTVEVRNLSTAAETLRAATEELQSLLAAMLCASVEEGTALIAARDQIDEDLAKADVAFITALGSDSLEALEMELITLRNTEASQAEILDALPKVEQGPEGLREGRETIAVEIGKIQTLMQNLEQELARGHETLAKDPLAATREELARKSEAVHTLQARLGPDPETSAASMAARHQELAELIAADHDARAEILGGRRPEDLDVRHKAVAQGLTDLHAKLTPLAEDAMEDTALAEAREAIAGLEQAKAEAETAHLRTKAELDSLDVDVLMAERDEGTVQMVVAQKEERDNQDYQLSTDERTRYEQRVQQLDKLIGEKDRDRARLEVKADVQADLQNQIADAGEGLATLERQVQYWERRLNVDTRIQALLEEARTRALAELSTRRLPEIVGGYLARVTGTRHGDVRFEDGAFRLYSGEKQDFLLDEEFSGGTRDQFYLVVRLAYLEALFSDARPPLLLDDPLVHCDPQRRAEVLRILAEYAGSGQVLLFTCHDFADYVHYPVVQL
jgi:uncharacterized protein YhaN